MSVCKLVLFIFCYLIISSDLIRAQSDPRIRGVLPRIDQAEDDLKWVIELSPRQDLKKQWKKLKEDVLDAFTQGIDLTQPFEVDAVFRKDELIYEFRIPVANFDGKDGLIDGIKGIGYTVKPIVKGSLYEFSVKGKKPYFLRYENNYAWISRSKEAIPANLPPAAQDMKDILNLKKDVVGQLKNDVAGLDSRRETFKQFRKQLESSKTKKRNEENSVFELRKLSLSQSLDEAESFIVEADELTVTWNTSTVDPNPNGRGEISLTAIPGTVLQQSIEELAAKPSHFANVVLHENTIFSGKINFALSAPRVKRLKEFYKALRPTLELKIDERTAETPAQRKAAKLASNKFLDMLDSGSQLHVIDAFVDVYTKDSGKNALVSGIRVVNGGAANEILDALKEMKSGWEIKKIDEYSGVTMHELTVPKARLENFRKIFAGESSLFVGISKDVIWAAAGADSITSMKSAIDQVAARTATEAVPVFLSYRLQPARVSALSDALDLESVLSDAMKAKEFDKNDKDAQKREKDAQKKMERYSKLADESMKGCEGMISGELRNTNNKIQGFLEINECALKYIGSLIADTIKETVQ